MQILWNFWIKSFTIAFFESIIIGCFASKGKELLFVLPPTRNMPPFTKGDKDNSRSFFCRSFPFIRSLTVPENELSCETWKRRLLALSMSSKASALHYFVFRLSMNKKTWAVALQSLVHFENFSMLKTGSSAEVCCIEGVAFWEAKSEFQLFSGCFRNSGGDNHKELTSSGKIPLDMWSARFILPILCRQQLVPVRFRISWTRLAMNVFSFSFEFIQPRMAVLSFQNDCLFDWNR